MFAKVLLLLAVLMMVSVEAQTTDTATGIFKANTYIYYWINPNALVGIALMLLFSMLAYIVLGLIAVIDGPQLMLEKCIDWGKVEKVEE